MIQLQSIRKVFRGGSLEVVALHGIDLDIPDGEFMAVMGPSGSGKSTLLNVLGCLTRPTSGAYRFGGRDVAGIGSNKLAKIRNREIGFVFQQFNLLPRLSALDNVEIPLVYADVPGPERRSRAAETLASLGLGERIDHFPTQLSGGEQQRVAIARALVLEPNMVLADEPTGNLDSTSGNEVMELIKELNEKGTTVILVTHNPEDAAYASRRITLRDGRVEEDTG